jgi:hypothetical protein
MAMHVPYLLVFLYSVWQEEDLLISASKGRERVGKKYNTTRNQSRSSLLILVPCEKCTF